MTLKSLKENELIIKPQKGWIGLNIKELWEYRELIFFFVWRDLKVRYKQTIIGISWILFQPLIAMIIFSIFFGKFAKIPSDGIPYPIFVYVGLIFWNYFSLGVIKASESVVINADIIQKIYFPRLIIPISSSLTPLVDFCVSFVIFWVLMVYYRYIPDLASIALIPMFLVISFFASVGLGSFMASVNAKYRDVRHVIPFFIQMLLFLTPVIYPVSIATGKFKYLFALNPISGVIETARATILHTKAPDWIFLLLSAVSATVFCIIGVVYFRKTERFFADFV